MENVAFDDASTGELVIMFNHEDQKVAGAVEKVLPIIAQAVDMIVLRLQSGGRMFYIGSGSGGKIAVLDATECPPTFGVSDDMVIAVLSGGPQAAVGWLEDTEDDEQLAVCDLKAKTFQGNDILIAVTASGNTPYALSGLKYAAKIGAPTIGVCCNKKNKLNSLVDLCINIDVGDEILRGSTRLKAGTAQKMVLNMLSSCAMIKLGRTYQNLMIEVRPINIKLQKRIVGIITTLTGTSDQTAKLTLETAAGNAKAAVLMLRKEISLEEAQKLLSECNGFLSKALGDENK